METIEVETPRCLLCKKSSTLQVPKDGFNTWRAGGLIQRALLMLTADEREMLMTGTHPECWDTITLGTTDGATD